MERQILQCTEDMLDIVAEGRYNLDAQARAYDLMEVLMEFYDGIPIPECLSEAASRFGSVYEENAAILSLSFDPSALKEEAAERIRPLEDSCNEARFEAAAAASLHEFAKEVFEIWQNSGVFARRRALKELRERAGFKLESHRIGNYVAKTYDLMNEAHALFAKAQQSRFSADVSYMIQPGIHDKIKILL